MSGKKIKLNGVLYIMLQDKFPFFLEFNPPFICISQSGLEMPDSC